MVLLLIMKTAKKHSKKIKKGAWFYPVRSSYLPCSWQAWLLYGIAVLYILPAFWIDLAKDQSVVYIVTNFATRLLLAGIVLTLIARQKS